MSAHKKRTLTNRERLFLGVTAALLLFRAMLYFLNCGSVSHDSLRRSSADNYAVSDQGRPECRSDGPRRVMVKGETTMQFTLDRFRSAHAECYETALEEIRSGRKQSHWMWFVFPQIQGLGRSAVAQYYEIQGKAEAMEYWKDPVLSKHLLEISEELLKLEEPIDQILGFPDNLKLRSCMTLFYLVSAEPVFQRVLDKFFDGSPDAYTVSKIMG